jgi:hypothetical protein
MTIETSVRVRVGQNGYDGDTPQDADSFRGKEGVISSIEEVHGTTVYYVVFEDASVNERYGETPTTAWPFYANELVTLDA